MKLFSKMQRILLFLVLLLSLMVTPSAKAAEPIVNLGTVTSYAVFSDTKITNSGTATKINGDIGIAPETTIIGLTADQLTNGTIHANDDIANAVQKDLILAYNDIMIRDDAKSVTTNLGGQTLSPGVYSLKLPATVTGTLKLDAQGDTNAVFIFQINSTLITGENSRIELINGAQFSRVFWQVANKVTLEKNTTFRGSILANASILAEAGVTVQGRLLAITGEVTLNNNQVNTTEIVPESDGDNVIPQVNNPPDIVAETPKIGELELMSNRQHIFYAKNS